MQLSYVQYQARAVTYLPSPPPPSLPYKAPFLYNFLSTRTKKWKSFVSGLNIGHWVLLTWYSKKHNVLHVPC